MDEKTDVATPAGETIAWLHEEINPHKTARLRELGPVNLGSLKSEILAVPDSHWDTPGDFEANYNKRGALRSTAHIILRFCDRRERPSPCYDRTPWRHWGSRLLPIMEAAVAPYGYARGFFPRIMLARLPAGAFINPHDDGDPSGTRPHKIHVPIATNPQAFFFIEGERYHLAEGHAYEVNNAARHSAANGGDSDRIHLIFEYLDADLQRFSEAPHRPR
jgi:hypothetical protein